MKCFLNLVFCFICVFAACSVLYAAVPSSRPGIGATPYSTGTTFRVWAPNASSVNAAGYFNGWSSSADPLASEGDGWWSADVEGAYKLHQYKYVMNGSHWRADTYAKDMDHSNGNGVIIENVFSWSPFTMPAWNELIIYEMHIGTYNDIAGGNPGTWNSAIAKLDHIQAMGINAVEIMPVAEFAGDFSLGYNPANLFAPESAYGSPNDMHNFVEACHQRGIAVLIDVIYNHMGPSDLDNSVWQFDGYSAYPDTGGIYFFEDENKDTPWGDRLNYVTSEVRSFIRDNVMYWLEEYNLDGLRWDGTAYIRERDGGYTVPGGWSLMQWINDEIDAAYSQKISIAEDMRDNEWITKTTGAGGAGFDSQWDAGFHHNLVGALTTADDVDRNMYTVKDEILGNYNGVDTQRVNYTESHDEVGSASGKSRVPEAIWPGNADSWYSKKRSTLGAGIMFTCPGIPMMFMGQEFLEDGSWHDDTPLDWTKDTTFAGIKQLYTDLIGLRLNKSNNTRGLIGSNVNVFHVNNTDKVVAFHRWYNGGPGDDVVIVANFGYQGFNNYNIGMPQGNIWHVRFNSDWDGYDSGFDDWQTYDTVATAGAKDGLSYNANINVGPYSVVILSQGSDPDINGVDGVDYDDFALLAGEWQNNCTDPSWCGDVDFNISGKVDMTDLYTFISSWLDGK
jgi:1,4-alpha-glucan branching enzyme